MFAYLLLIVISIISYIYFGWLGVIGTIILFALIKLTLQKTTQKDNTYDLVNNLASEYLSANFDVVKENTGTLDVKYYHAEVSMFITRILNKGTESNSTENIDSIVDSGVKELLEVYTSEGDLNLLLSIESFLKQNISKLLKSRNDELTIDKNDSVKLAINSIVSNANTTQSIILKRYGGNKSDFVDFYAITHLVGLSIVASSKFTDSELSLVILKALEELLPEKSREYLIDYINDQLLEGISITSQRWLPLLQATPCSGGEDGVKKHALLLLDIYKHLSRR